MHNAVPAGGGFDELTTVICLHGAGETGRAFQPLLQLLGSDRSVFAPDLPGSGESDHAGDVDAITAGTQAVLDFARSMRIRSFDLVARGAGCDLALRLAAQPDSGVRRVVLITDRPPTGTGASTATILPLSATDLAAQDERLVAVLSQ